MVVAKNVPYEFRCINLVEGSRSSLSPFPDEYKIAADLLLESSSFETGAADTTEKGSHTAKKFLPEVSSPNGVYVSKSSYLIPSTGVFKKMNSRWDDAVGPYLCEHTGSLAGSIINKESAFRTGNPLTYDEIVNLKAKIPSDLSSRWDYVKDISPKISNTIYMSFYYRSDSAFGATVNWKIDENETVKVAQVSCGPSWKKFTAQTTFSEFSAIAPYLKFSYSSSAEKIYVSPVFLSWDENEFPSSKLLLLEKWSDKFRSKVLDNVYYTIYDPNPSAPVEKKVKYRDVPEGQRLVSDYCEWFKSWAFLVPDYFVPLYNFVFDKNYANFNDILEDSHISTELENFFLSREGLDGFWGLRNQADVSNADNLYIIDVISQGDATYDSYKYITVSAHVGDLLNSKITSAFNRGVDPNSTVLRSSLLKEGV